MDNFNTYFHYLIYCNTGDGNYYNTKFKKGLDFLRSLNLTDDQYKELGKLIELYGEEQYQSCEDRHIDDESY